jgi:hypothetical protein
MWRETSMALLVMALGMSKEDVQTAKEGHDVLGQGSDASQLMRASLAQLSKARSRLERAASSSQELAARTRRTSWEWLRRSSSVGSSSGADELAARTRRSSQDLLRWLRRSSVGSSSGALVTSTAAESSLAAQQAQGPLQLALDQPHLVSHERQTVTLAQLPGASIDLGSSRRDQRRRSSALSAASSVARRYRSLDDDMEVAQDGL